MVLEERSPGLREWLLTTQNEPGNGALRDFEAKLEQFAVNAWRTPKRIRERHRTDEFGALGNNTWSTHPSAVRRPGPKSAEALPMPANHGLGANDVERLAPPRPLA